MRCERLSLTARYHKGKAMKITPARLGLLREARSGLAEIAANINAYYSLGEFNPDYKESFKRVMQLIVESYDALHFVAEGKLHGSVEAMHGEVVEVLMGILKEDQRDRTPKISQKAWDILKITIDYPPVCPYPPIVVPDPEKQ